MTAKIILWLLATVVLRTVSPAPAQPLAKMPRIGLLIGGSSVSDASRIEAFLQGLRELGYMDAKNIAVEYRYADGKPDRLSENTQALVRLKVDVIVAGGPLATRTAKEATTTIPVVMAQVNDPIGAGLVINLARPGGNITGLSAMSPEISGKQVELLKEIVPKLSRIDVLGTSSIPGTAQALNETETSSRALGMKLQFLDVKSVADIQTAFRSLNKGHVEPLLLLSSPILIVHRKEIIELAAKHRAPAMYFAREFVEDGGLMTYAANVPELWRRAATYVDKILKGAKPADLPVEQPKKFEFIVNLKAAKQIGLTIPPNVLVRADKVIR